MPTFKHDNLDFYFVDEGEGEPIVLVHGFASNHEINWVLPIGFRRCETRAAG